ncbi:DUF4097 and DUF4098 domain-containing protein YvlB [Actinoplanes lutulentus]|uniref:Putative adhesin n=1 Tax=Actinoplanes lutulentus TaxID=1287878 RepID=A0A327ZB42_9ACTN|nr:DUF4097 family beta strand repeat-containing protein [Actinoplanes lutulentus]MBB2948578.1 DUF4097 and DUF4098 domain-containing protein YvlB [Actinoplanes lutulentus]RAK36729.1 putative adhesin [Actinoplanes lutulentus]
MPIFDTSEPISVAVDLSVGHVTIAAGDRVDTIVEVRPSNEANDSDVEAAQQVRVDFSTGTLRVTGPKRVFDFSHKTKSVTVSIELPADSRVTAEVQLGDLRATGRLGESRFKTAAGHVSVEQTGALRVRTSAGDVTATSIAGDADIATGTGRITVGEIDGNAVLKNSNGDTTIAAVTGTVRVRAANGDITVEQAGAGADAKSSNGSVRLGSVARGSVVLETALGNLDVGIASGTAAWLDVNTSFGRVRNLLENSPGPDATDETVEVRGRTTYGDITIHRGGER